MSLEYFSYNGKDFLIIQLFAMKTEIFLDGKAVGGNGGLPPVQGQPIAIGSKPRKRYQHFDTAILAVIANQTGDLHSGIFATLQPSITLRSLTCAISLLSLECTCTKPPQTTAPISRK